MSHKKPHLQSLNAEQFSAVQYNNSSQMIIAGPGSGKTKTLVAKILYLLNDLKVDSSSILVLTFTNKAANEIKERLKSDSKATGIKILPFVGTFHGFCYQCLSKKDQVKKFIENHDRTKLIKKAIQDSNSKYLLELGPRELSLLVSKIKNLSLDKKTIDCNISSFYQQYEGLLENSNQIDYDDLLLNFYQSLKSGQIKKEYKYILVDEFQDTNNIQFELLKLLSNEKSCLTVIGDPKQAIYSFRGSSSGIFEKFKSLFSDVEVFPLVKNYRNAKRILSGSEKFLHDANDIDSLRQQIVSSVEGELKLIKTINAFSEADWVIKDLSQKVGGINLLEASDMQHVRDEAKFSDFAVMFRIHSLSRILESKFKQSGLPYRKLGSYSFFNQPLIKFIINIFKIIYFDQDTLIIEILDAPFMNLSGKIKKEILDFQDFHKLKPTKAMRIFVDSSNTGSKEYQKITSLINLIKKLKKVESKINLIEAVDLIIETFRLEEYLKKKKNHEIVFYELKSVLVRFKDQNNQLKSFLEYLSMIEAKDYYDSSADTITLLTMHASKGLEFDYVYLCGFEDGLVPYKYGKESNINLEEEKRLLYVALTRAKKAVYLLKTERRFKQKTGVSLFEKKLIESGLKIFEDEKNIDIRKRIERRQQKENQMNLF